ncbi:hypothetical protein Trco_005942 [Trichoderma cornu-damae]|uniref:Uncharacterized protein n=1 Tax=Trichoderma cornu-damae TaxID=654480 RepID=A0A9P8TWZ5_9HYPO|nr:hypothetical protein Trco_005942 [Trichoderma cornu-damae]
MLEQLRDVLGLWVCCEEPVSSAEELQAPLVGHVASSVVVLTENEMETNGNGFITVLQIPCCGAAPACCSKDTARHKASKAKQALLKNI